MKVRWFSLRFPRRAHIAIECSDETVGLVGKKSGTIKFGSGRLAVGPIMSFEHTSRTWETKNTMTFYGQLSGGNVTVRNLMTMRYVLIGMPGVEFPSTIPTATSGYPVDVVYKREIKNP